MIIAVVVYIVSVVIHLIGGTLKGPFDRAIRPLDQQLLLTFAPLVNTVMALGILYFWILGKERGK